MNGIDTKIVKRILGVLFAIILVAGVAHAVAIDVFNKTERSAFGADESQATYLKFDNRADSTSTWVKRDYDLRGTRVDLQAQTVDGVVCAHEPADLPGGEDVPAVGVAGEHQIHLCRGLGVIVVGLVVENDQIAGAIQILRQRLHVRPAAHGAIPPADKGVALPDGEALVRQDGDAVFLPLYDKTPIGKPADGFQAFSPRL